MASPRAFVNRVPLLLVVDPDPDMRDLYNFMFAGVASEIVAASDGAEALAMAIARPPDLIVCDTHLPRIDGYTVVSSLRLDPTLRSTAAVLVTAAAFPSEIARAVESGADEVVIKPYAPDSIIDAIARAVAARRSIAGRTPGSADTASSSPPEIGA